MGPLRPLIMALMTEFFSVMAAGSLAEAKNIYVDDSIEQRLTVSKRVGL